MFELLVRVEFMENLEENSEISIFNGDDESWFLNIIWLVVIFKKDR